MATRLTVKLPPKERPKSMTMHDMYLVSTKQYGKFGIDGYEVPKIYQDPQKQVQDRKFAEYRKKNKWPKETKATTKRGHFMDDELKLKKGQPGPNKYKMNADWVSKKDIEKGRNLPKNTTKNSYIDQIVKSAKLGGTPGVGKYQIIKTQEQIKKEIQEMKTKVQGKGADRQLNVDYVQFVASTIPGPGQYNPHNPAKENLHPKVNQDKPEDWRRKHADQEKSRKRATTAGIGQYKTAHIQFGTFDRILEKNKGKGNDIKAYFGKETRFKDPKKTKSLTQKIIPGPSHYNMSAKWIGKEEGMKGNTKKNANWMNRVSRGISKSIYY